MTSQYGPLIEKIVNNERTNFMRLGDVHMEQKKYVSTLNFDSSDAAFTLLLPQCATKAGIIEQSSKTYVDLLFESSSSDVKELVDLLIAMEEEAAKQLHSRSGEWFEGNAEQMTVQSFEDMFTPVVRYVNRQRNVCVRVHIPTSSRGIKQASTGYDCDVYDKLGKTRLLSDIRADTQIRPLVEVKEIRMTSTSLNLHLNLVECMIVKDSEAVTENTDQRAPSRRIPLASAALSDVAEDQEKEVVNEEQVEAQIELSNEHQESEVAIEPAEEPATETLVETNVNDEAGSGTDVATNDYVETNKCEVGVNDTNNEVKESEDEFKESIPVNPNSDSLLGEVEIGRIEAESDILEEVGVLELDEAEPIKLKKPDEVYKDIYKAAITKAKKLRQVALEAYLDAKKIKAKFMLEDIYDSDEDGDEDEDDAELEEVTSLSVQ